MPGSEKLNNFTVYISSVNSSNVKPEYFLGSHDIPNTIKFFSLKALAVVRKPAFLMHCKNVQNVLSKFTSFENGTWKAGRVCLFLNWTRSTRLFQNLLRDELELTDRGFISVVHVNFW